MHPTCRTIPVIRAVFACAALAGFPLGAANLLYQEGFNTDGVAAGRYTMVGRDVYEVPRIQSELANYDQKGPIYWDHNFKVSFVGVPEIPARRVILTWRTDPAKGAATEDLLQLVDSTVNWLLNGKKNATIVVFPNAASINELADRFTAAGHTVVDDDPTQYPDENDVPGDLYIHGPGAGNPSRYAGVAKPVIVMSEPDYDDMLVGSIGSLATFDPGNVTVAAPGHPAAGGKTGTFKAFNNPAQPFGLVGSFLPPNATTLATVTRIVPPAVTTIGDVDAMIAGTKQHNMTAGTMTEIDFSDASTGNWPVDNALPGAYAGNWGLRVQGKITVKKAGTYRFALGSDDGARFQIDQDRNGFTASDTILDDPGPHGHQIVYANVNFAAAGDFDFEIRSYNSGGGGSLELSVPLVPVPVPDDALDSGFWEVLSQFGSADIVLRGAADVTGYVAVGPDVAVETPLIVALNGPTDTPPGSFYDGGAFSGFEGAGFIGASGLNKWTAGYEAGYRSLQLAPINVAGKTNLHLTIALAATQTDFETSDFLDVVVYPKGLSSAPVTLAHFRGVVNAAQPWMADEKENFVRRLTKRFADFTYEIPAGATDLIVEIRAATTWWTEIVAFDNIRITAGELVATPPVLSTPVVTADSIKLAWADGEPPFLVEVAVDLAAGWTGLVTTSERSVTLPVVGPYAFFRVQSKTSASVKLYSANLSGAAEVPAVDTPGMGRAIAHVEGTALGYYLVYDGLKAAATAAHIHGPAAVGANAGVMVPLVAVGPLATAGAFHGTATLTADQKTAIESGQAYFNVHTSAHAGGEIRGQIVPVP